MNKARLPSYLEPRKSGILIRLGKSNDGGYLVNAEDIKKPDCVVSFGIGLDWSFEEGFLKHKQVPIFAFDGSLGKAPRPHDKR